MRFACLKTEAKEDKQNVLY